MSSSKDIKEDRICLIERAISIYSPSGSEGELAAFITSELKGRGFEPRIDSAGNVICEASLSGGHSILLCGHMDTVPGELETRRKGSLIYGRGAADAKGALMSLLFAFEDFVKTEGGKDRLIFAAVVNEEGDSSGLNQLIRDKIKADYAIFGEPGGLDKITVGYRGHIPLKLEVETPEVHSSAPWLSTNSAEIAMRTYEELKRALGAQGTSEETVRKVSVALTQISAGRAHNVTPGLTTASIDIRLPLGTTTAQVMSKVEEVISSFRQSVEGKKARILATFGEPTEPYSAKISSPLVRALSRSIIKGSANKPTLISKSGTGDMNTYALSFGSQCVTYGPGDAKLSHTSGEFVDANEVISCSRVLVAAIEELVASSPK